MSARPYALDAAFRDFGTGERFCVDWRPPAVAVGALLILPPFGEEMNKARRALASAARSFAENGWFVRLVDAFGTGDSQGEFGAATWDTWLGDYTAAAQDLARTSGSAVAYLAVRAGVFAAQEIASTSAPLLLWQPMQSGDQQLTHLLRMRVAQESFAGAPTAASTRQLRAQLEEGHALEIGGYELNPALVLPMSRCSLDAMPPRTGRILWLETGPEPRTDPPPASARTIDALKGRGIDVIYDHAIGEPFWATVEIEDAPRLAERSLAWLGSVAPC
ncbi:MAG: hydrolase 2, exosortase A system-associated [Burkholderiales bacterium]|nr:hydrolase 2, exosortase A system-associated [Burkholderiales bacterium]